MGTKEVAIAGFRRDGLIKDMSFKLKGEWLPTLMFAAAQYALNAKSAMYSWTGEIALPKAQVPAI
jgi:hypothetical protein